MLLHTHKDSLEEHNIDHIGSIFCFVLDNLTESMSLADILNNFVDVVGGVKGEYVTLRNFLSHGNM